MGAYGCSSELAPFLTTPVVVKGDDSYTVEVPGHAGSTQVREYLGNIPVIVKAYAWLRAMGAAGVKEGADLSLLANNYMETRLLQISGVTKGLPHLEKYRMEMTRYSLGDLTEETGVTTVDVANRMTDYGVDAFWMSHEPWFVPEPFTPEAGEMWSIEDLDYWIDVVAAICEEGPHRSRSRQDLPPQPADPPDSRVGARRSGQVGDHLACLPPQERWLR